MVFVVKGLTMHECFTEATLPTFICSASNNHKNIIHPQYCSTRISPPTIRYTVNCTLPDKPSNGAIMDYEMLMINETVLEGTVLTYQCDNGLSLTGPNTITCTIAGVWTTEPETISCMNNSEGA